MKPETLAKKIKVIAPRDLKSLKVSYSPRIDPRKVVSAMCNLASCFNALTTFEVSCNASECVWYHLQLLPVSLLHLAFSFLHSPVIEQPDTLEVFNRFQDLLSLNIIFGSGMGLMQYVDGDLMLPSLQNLEVGVARDEQVTAIALTLAHVPCTCICEIDDEVCVMSDVCQKRLGRETVWGPSHEFESDADSQWSASIEEFEFSDSADEAEFNAHFDMAVAMLLAGY